MTIFRKCVGCGALFRPFIYNGQAPTHCEKCREKR